MKITSSRITTLLTIGENLNSEFKRAVERMFGKLSQGGRIVRVGGKRFGHWEVIGWCAKEAQ